MPRFSSGVEWSGSLEKQITPANKNAGRIGVWNNKYKTVKVTNININQIRIIS